MRHPTCEREEAVLAAGDELDAALEAHAATCARCGQARRMAEGLRHLAHEDRMRLPTAAQVWWRARIVQRLSAGDPHVEQAKRPLVWGLGMGVLTALVALTMVAGLALSQVRTVFSGASMVPAAGWTYFALWAGVVPVVAAAVVVLWLLREA